MFEPFFIRALLGGIGIALIAGPLGCLVVWKRMAYFGDSLAHSSLIGIALGIVFNIHSHISILISGILFAFILVYLQRRRILATDTLLGILAHASLAIGLVTITLADANSVNIHALLFGDILTITWLDVAWIYLGTLITAWFLRRHWDSLLLATMNEDLAEAEGHNTKNLQLIFMILMALMVAISIQLVGILLIASLLIIPAAAARQFSVSPTHMATLASIAGAVSVLFGLLFSYEFDTPTGPSIVLIATGLFLGALVSSSFKKR